MLFGPGKAANAGGVATSPSRCSRTPAATPGRSSTPSSGCSDIMKDIHDRAPRRPRSSACPGNYVVGANIAGFLRVAEAMLALGIV